MWFAVTINGTISYDKLPSVHSISITFPSLLFLIQFYILTGQYKMKIASNIKNNKDIKSGKLWNTVLLFPEAHLSPIGRKARFSCALCQLMDIENCCFIYWDLFSILYHCLSVPRHSNLIYPPTVMVNSKAFGILWTLFSVQLCPTLYRSILKRKWDPSLNRAKKKKNTQTFTWKIWEIVL